MARKIVLALCALVLVSAIFYIIWLGRERIRTPFHSTAATSTTITTDTKTIYIYVSSGCPHCRLLQFNVQKSEIDKRLPLVFRDAGKYPEEYASAVQACGKGPEIPLLLHGKICIIGETLITNYLEATAR